jgi:DNA-binding NarL/FixJ family response regulator
LALAGLHGETASPFDSLTPRELEVALLLNQGLRQESIAKHLSLSAKTVNTHKARLFDKLGIHDNIALARLASQYGIVDPSSGLH